jgi:SAM-dependent methyltransferase
VELFHGTTVHGKQALDPMEHRKPTFYYARSGPLGDVFEAVNARRHDAAIGITGMGAGGIAAYLEAGQTMTFFEIDPVVVRVASDPQLFTYLAEAPVPPRVVLGDARLSLREEATGTYDALILDAFSSDAIPAHLITLEALREDIRVLRPDGLLVVHVSNRYYDLSPAIGAAGAELGLAVLERRYSPTDAEGRAGAPNDVGVEPLTDDHPDVLRFLRWFGG